jgi:hypothetical protein
MGHEIDQHQAGGAEGVRVKIDQFSNPILSYPHVVVRPSPHVLERYCETMDFRPDQHLSKGHRARAFQLVEM